MSHKWTHRVDARVQSRHYSILDLPDLTAHSLLTTRFTQSSPPLHTLQTPTPLPHTASLLRLATSLVTFLVFLPYSSDTSAPRTEQPATAPLRRITLIAPEIVRTPGSSTVRHLWPRPSLSWHLSRSQSLPAPSPSPLWKTIGQSSNVHRARLLAIQLHTWRRSALRLDS